MTELWPFSVSEKCFSSSSFAYGTIWMKIHTYMKDQRLHIVHKSHNSGCFILELFALDTSKCTLQASDQ